MKTIVFASLVLFSFSVFGQSTASNSLFSEDESIMKTGDVDLELKDKRGAEVVQNRPGTEEQPVEDVTLFPNPFSDQLFITGLKGNNGAVEIMTMDGKVVVSQSFHEKSITINLPELPDGIYIVRITDDNAVIVKRGAKR